MLIEMVAFSLTVLTSLPSLTTHVMPQQRASSLTSSVPEKKLIAMLSTKKDRDAFSDNIIPQEEIVAMLATTSPQAKTNTPEPETPTPTEIPLPTATPTPIPPTPSTTPTPQPIVASPTDLDSLFTRYSDEYHIDREVLKRIAACESGFNTTSHNTTYGYAGMYQFAESSWTTVRARMGEDTNPELRFSAEESIKTAAYHIANGGRGAWPNCQ